MNSNKNSKEMGVYKITITDRAKKEIKKLPDLELKRIHKKIEAIARNPYMEGATKLVGSSRSYRVRQGDYRILYEVETSVIDIVSIGHRRDVYR